MWTDVLSFDSPEMCGRFEKILPVDVGQEDLPQYIGVRDVVVDNLGIQGADDQDPFHDPVGQYGVVHPCALVDISPARAQGYGLDKLTTA